MTRTRIIQSTIPKLRENVSIEKYCADRFTYLTQNQWINEIVAGKVSINGEVELNPAERIFGGEILSYDGRDIVEPPVDENIKILYRDEWLIAVNKTGDLPVHPAGRYFNNTLVFLLEDRLGQKVYPVHRLDRETSGVILLTFDSVSAGDFSQSIANGSKEYLALVHGVFSDHEIIMDLPLGRDRESAIKKKRKAWADGTESARTRFVKVLTADDISLIRCFPETGRLHQIRAHLLAAGFPIMGDKLYGRDERAFLTFIEHGFTLELEKLLILPRSALHAAKIRFWHPYHKKEMIICAPLPTMFCECILSRRENG